MPSRPEEQSALHHSYECFFNSLLRESTHLEENPEKLIARFEKETGLNLHCERTSLTGRFHYQRCERTRASLLRDVQLALEWYQKAHPGQLCRVEQVLSRVEESVEMIEESLLYAGDQFDALTIDSSFLQTEQALLYGHNFHPHPKSRGGLGPNERRLYTPEARGSFYLIWCDLDPELLVTHAPHSDEIAQFEELKRLEGRGDSPHAFPFHPYQWSWLRMHSSHLNDWLATERIRRVGLGKLLWYPTSSMRSIYSPHSPLMLKSSLSLRLTNSIRVLTKSESERGVMVQEAFLSKRGQAFLKRHPYFHVLYEPGFRHLQTPEGEALPETLIVSRDNPFHHSKGEWVLGALLQKHPYKDTTYLEEFVRQDASRKKISTTLAANHWLNAYVEKVMTPFLMAHAELGIWLGAHQQNIVLKLGNENPIEACYFRDCQGTGYTEWSYPLFTEEGVSLDRQNGNILPAQMGNALFSYYLTVNSTFNFISALAGLPEISEQKLFLQLHDALERLLAQKPRDPSCLHYLLDSTHLWQKGNFRCSVLDLNENTHSDPFSLYTKMPNPLRRS